MHKMDSVSGQEGIFMGKGRIVEKHPYVPPGTVGKAFRQTTEEREVEQLRARVAELEKEIETLKKMHELEMENLKLRLEGQVQKLQNEARGAFPLASRLFSKLDGLIDQEIEAARAEVKQE